MRRGRIAKVEIVHCRCAEALVNHEPELFRQVEEAKRLHRGGGIFVVNTEVVEKSGCLSEGGQRYKKICDSNMVR